MMVCARFTHASCVGDDASAMRIVAIGGVGWFFLRDLIERKTNVNFWGVFLGSDRWKSGASRTYGMSVGSVEKVLCLENHNFWDRNNAFPAPSVELGEGIGDFLF